MSAWSCQVRVDIQLISWNASGYSQLHRLTGGNLLTFFLTYPLSFFLTFFLTYLLTLFLTFFLIYLLTFCLTFFLAFFLTSSDILSDKSSDILSDTLSDILLSDTFRGWGPARNTGLTGSRLRSGAEHWTHRLAVEVRRGTLASQDRGWGPARNTELTGSRLRSGAEHWTHRIAVEVRCGTLASQDRGWGPVRNTDHASSQDETKEKAEEEKEKEEEEVEVKADIKSNNPHLTGGEKTKTTETDGLGLRPQKIRIFFVGNKNNTLLCLSSWNKVNWRTDICSGMRNPSQ